jgi:hypothetical protein
MPKCDEWILISGSTALKLGFRDITEYEKFRNYLDTTIDSLPRPIPFALSLILLQRPSPMMYRVRRCAFDAAVKAYKENMNNESSKTD